jgi:hypothetical protein
MLTPSCIQTYSGCAMKRFINKRVPEIVNLHDQLAASAATRVTTAPQKGDPS